MLIKFPPKTHEKDAEAIMYALAESNPNTTFTLLHEGIHGAFAIVDYEDWNNAHMILKYEDDEDDTTI